MTAPATDTHPEALLERQDEGGVVTLTLNRPAQYNALSEDLLKALREQLTDIAGDREVRVVVLAGAGKAFCAGHDLKELRADPRPAYYEELFAKCSDVMLAITRLTQPVIARVHGLATAAGCQLVATCDLAVASEEASFAVSGIRVGLFCSTPAVALSRNVSRKRAFEMLMTGEFIDAATALERGLVNRVVPADELDDEVRALCESICEKSPAAVTLGKRMFYQQLECGLESAYEHASRVMASNMLEADAVERIDAFIHKRPSGA